MVDVYEQLDTGGGGHAAAVFIEMVYTHVGCSRTVKFMGLVAVGSHTKLTVV